jgi:hypothetical protein
MQTKASPRVVEGKKPDPIADPKADGFWDDSQLSEALEDMDHWLGADPDQDPADHRQTRPLPHKT